MLGDDTKTVFPQHLTDLRPISLCNVSSKILAKVLNTRLSQLLPRIISSNQSGFIRGRLISENIMLAQEMLKGIWKPTQGGNVVLKLDMAKAYDRVSWPYLCKLMEKLGFSEVWIDMIHRHISSNMYSLILNSQRHGFFKSENGLRQGDPISPSLFVLSAELLSNMLNNLYENRRFTGFCIPRQGPQVNHLAFADNMILFVSGKKKTMRLVMKTLTKYEKISGQQINKSKSCFMVAPGILPGRIRRISSITGMQHKQFPVKYLGCPLFIGRQKIAYVSEMINKVTSRVKGWQNKFLSPGGKAILIWHVLQVIPIHTLSAMHPPNGVLTQIEKTLANFF